MTPAPDRPPARRFSRRGLIAGSAAVSATLAAAGGSPAGAAMPYGPGGKDTEPFYGPWQSGILTPQQRYLAFGTFDVVAPGRAGLAELLDAWSSAAPRLTAGRSVASRSDPGEPPTDGGAALGLAPARLTLTVGFGPGLFDGRFGLAALRPAALADLPPLPGDALDPATSGGDLCVQSCADDLQVAVHGLSTLAALVRGSATLRAVQLGFASASLTADGKEGTPRNLLGFKDGTANRAVETASGASRVVWVGAESDQRWMRGGTYLVARRIRVMLDAWSRTSLDGQESAIGRQRPSGAPLGGKREFDAPDFAVTSGGKPVIPVNAHIRQASPQSNGGVQLLRRAYNYVDGLDPLTGSMETGLAFHCFQQDPSNQFVAIQRRLASSDTLTTNYLVHTRSAVFACPPGLDRGGGFGDHLGLSTRSGGYP